MHEAHEWPGHTMLHLEAHLARQIDAGAQGAYIEQYQETIHPDLPEAAGVCLLSWE